MKPLSAEETPRYARQLSLPEFGAEGQDKLRAARVLLIGAGGLGSPSALYLAAAGVGTIGIVDPDAVELSNLHRQILHRSEDVRRPKVESARDTLCAINPHVRVELFRERFTAANAVDLARGWDIVVDGSDNFPTRYASNDACVVLGIPNVYGSVWRFEGQVSVFAPHLGGPCYRCLNPQAPAPGVVPSCAEAGVLGVMPGLVGILQALEAIKLITGIGTPLVGTLMVYDGLEMQYRTVRIRKDPNCAVCGTNPTVTELIDYEAFCGTISDQAAEAARDATISVQDLRRMLDAREAGRDDFVLIDVREPHEYEIVAIPGSVLIPKDRFLDGSALADLPTDRRIVLHCKVGGRSAEALAVVKGAGFADAVHVGGGVLAWVQQVEPDKPTY